MTDQNQNPSADSNGLPFGRISQFVEEEIIDDELAEHVEEQEPERWDDPALVRLFKRLGNVPMSWSSNRTALRICSAAARASKQHNCHPGDVYRDLTLFCNAEHEGVCVEVPDCGRCPISDACDYPDRKPSIKEWPESERPRERLLKAGEETMSDSELLAIILGGGTRRESALELARKMLSRFGDFRSLAGASVSDMSAIRGIGPAKVAQVKAALGIARRFASRETAIGDLVQGSRQLFEHFHERLRKLKKETFFSLLLDTKHRMIAEEQVAVGSLSESVVHPREVFRKAVAESAAAVIFVHNHPSGNSQPSPQDRALTRRLCEAGRLMGIRVLDHLIIGKEEYFSFAEQGLIDGNSND